MNARAALDAAGVSIITLALTISAAFFSPARAIAGEATPVTIVAFGDSLTAGYGVKADESFAAQLQMALQAKGHKVKIVNAGVSGDTTAGGLERLDWSLQPKPDGVILELGANDALRGVDPKETRANLDKILAKLKAENIDVLIAGMKAPSNWGADYQKEFDAIYPELATKYGATLYPFFLEGVALDRAFIQADGLHPTAKGVAEIVKRIMPDVEKLLTRIRQHETAGK
jgi:acyl-CoA thioesterase-1